MNPRRGRKAKEAWRTRASARSELVRGWAGGATAIGVRTVGDREAAEAAHFVRAVGVARRSIRSALTEVGFGLAALWERREASQWTTANHESSVLWAELAHTVDDMEAIRDRLEDHVTAAEQLFSSVNAGAKDGRRNELARHVLGKIGAVAPDVAASGTAMAYWQLALFGMDGTPGRNPRGEDGRASTRPPPGARFAGREARTRADFKRVEAKWTKAIARLRREARATTPEVKRRRIS